MRAGPAAGSRPVRSPASRRGGAMTARQVADGKPVPAVAVDDCGAAAGMLMAVRDTAGRTGPRTGCEASGVGRIGTTAEFASHDVIHRLIIPTPSSRSDAGATGGVSPRFLLTYIRPVWRGEEGIDADFAHLSTRPASPWLAQGVIDPFRGDAAPSRAGMIPRLGRGLAFRSRRVAISSRMGSPCRERPSGPR